MSEPRIAVLTVTTNAARHLEAYFDALERVTSPGWRLVIVDNGSRDGSAEVVRRRCPGARLIENGQNLGFTGACNRALRELRDDPQLDFVLFLNDDTEVTPEFLEPLLAAAADGRTLVAPKTYLADGAGQLDDSAGQFDWWRGTWKRRRLPPASDGARQRARPIDNANLSCLLVPRSAFHEVGLLDDAFFVYYDDTDFCRRALEAGYRILYEPRSIVFHRKGATLGGQLSAFGCYYLARNRPYLMRKHLPRWRFGVFLSYYLATRTARCVVWASRGRRDLAHATWHGFSDFIRGRMGRGNPPG